MKVPRYHLSRPNMERSTSWIERLKRERELKLTLAGRTFHAFKTIRSLTKFALMRETRG